MKSKIKQIIAETKDTKPYNQCIACEHFCVTCSGANFLSMPIHRMGEWARIRKEYLGWSNEYIAQATGISVTTVSRFLGGHLEDVKVTTAQAIYSLLTADFAGSMPCYDINSIEPVEVTHPLTAQKIKQYEKEIASLEKQLEDIKADAQVKLEFLRAAIERKDAIIEKKDIIIEKKDALIERLATK